MSQALFHVKHYVYICYMCFSYIYMSIIYVYICIYVYMPGMEELGDIKSLVGLLGFEPRTYGLRVRYSTS